MKKDKGQEPAVTPEERADPYEQRRSPLDERADSPERAAARAEVRTTDQVLNEGTVGETAEPEQSVEMLNASLHYPPRVDRPEDRPTDVVRQGERSDPNAQARGWDQTEKERSGPGIHEEVDIDGPGPRDTTRRVEPGSIFGEIGKWEPVIAELSDAIQQALRASGYTAPVIRIKVAGHHIRIGPTPIQVEP